MRAGKVSASRPEGLTFPVKTSAIAPPPAWPPSQASSTPDTLASQGIATAEPLTRTTTTRAAARAAVSMSARCPGGRSMDARSFPSDS